MTITHINDTLLLEKYSTAGPRYTSYPTALAFTSAFCEADLSESIKILRAKHKQQSRSAKPQLSLYLHVPFCHSLCYYCGCNKIVTRNTDKLSKYTTYLKKEIIHRSRQFSDFEVSQIHLGGGTPSFLSTTQLQEILDTIYLHFSLSEKIEKSIEIDPRELENKYLFTLKQLGFTRVSFGVQDVSDKVQKKINRVQSTALLNTLISQCKSLAFKSVNIDLIYGLPGQSIDTLKQTMQVVSHLAPDRISLFSYAHMPTVFAAQRKIKDEDLPTDKEKFALFRFCINSLNELGYDFIGMDHFAKPQDELSLAAKNKTLYRNFQGYTTDSSNCILGLGVSSISSIGNSYSQNHKKLKNYYQAIDNHQTTIEKGISLTKDDEIRRALIHQLMCNFTVDKHLFSQKYAIQFNQFFKEELKDLAPFIEDNLLSDCATSITIHARGRLLIRNICMSFDAYIGSQRHKLRYSRVI